MRIPSSQKYVRFGPYLKKKSIQILINFSGVERSVDLVRFLRPTEIPLIVEVHYFENEIFRLSEKTKAPAIDIESKVYIMTLRKFCKGKPKGYKGENIYVLMDRYDPTRHSFSRLKPVSKAAPSKAPNCFHYELDEFDSIKDIGERKKLNVGGINIRDSNKFGVNFP